MTILEVVLTVAYIAVLFSLEFTYSVSPTLLEGSRPLIPYLQLKISLWRCGLIAQAISLVSNFR